MRSSELLRSARIYIETDINVYVCNAIMAAGRELDEYVLSDALKLWIRETLLGGRHMLDEWMDDIHHETYNQMNALSEAGETNPWKDVRLAWMDWMIAYHESKGD